jgi:polyphosphate glucokinase
MVIDVGGSRVKALVSGEEVPVRSESGPEFTADQMVDAVLKMTAHWSYDVITVGVPTVVRHGQIIREPVNLGGGWAGYDFAAAFGKPVKVINDAAMQAIAAYEGGRMLFLGLGTGLGSTMILDNVVAPMELGHVPYRKGLTYEQHVGGAGLKRLGKKAWRRHVLAVIGIFYDAFGPDYVVLGGGNTKYLEEIPDYARIVPNISAFSGGFRLWDDVTDP